MNALTRIAGFLGLLLLTACGAAGRECASLREMGRDPAIIAALERWVDDRQSKGLLDQAHEVDGPIASPGVYRVKIDDPALEAQLGRGMDANVVTSASDEVSSVFFAYRNYRGLVVYVGVRDFSMIPEKALDFVSQRTAIMCIERD